ncbi:Uncharacterised protein [[Eubacterium] contortum]|uniref:Uncharacterized protein n=1 Tax=Faecalicatena contorta TaxID=39482 RepID=A0A173YM30_9FIRM|nr:hypothetical protein [Faecalicatena contorta]CUN64974.1 Uncharacterised protein [[Eubacterium] contortum] [Faecalicatena contorta]
MAKKQPDINIPQHEIEALARCLLPDIQKFFESPEGKKNLKNGKRRGQKKQKRKGAYDKSDIIHDTAAFNDNPIIKLFQEIELM